MQFPLQVHLSDFAQAHELFVAFCLHSHSALHVHALVVNLESDIVIENSVLFGAVMSIYALSDFMVVFSIEVHLLLLGSAFVPIEHA